MEKFGFLAILLVWGGLIYFFFFGGPVSANINGSDFFASALSSISGSLKQQEGIIGIVDASGNFQAAKVHSNSGINIFDIEISQSNPGLMFAGSNRGLFISKDNGLNWYDFSDIEHKIDSDSKVYKISEGFVSVFSGGKGLIYRSQDNFFSLYKLIDFNNEAVYDFDVNNDNLYLATSNGRLLLYSLQRGEVRVLTDFGSAIKQMKVLQAGKLIYLTLQSGGFWVSNDHGETFERMGFLDDYRGANTINHFDVSVVNNSIIYAATNYGLIRSFDAGETWRVFKSLPSEGQSVYCSF